MCRLVPTQGHTACEVTWPKFVDCQVDSETSEKVHDKLYAYCRKLPQQAILIWAECKANCLCSAVKTASFMNLMMMCTCCRMMLQQVIRMMGMMQGRLLLLWCCQGLWAQASLPWFMQQLRFASGSILTLHHVANLPTFCFCLCAEGYSEQILYTSKQLHLEYDRLW